MLIEPNQYLGITSGENGSQMTREKIVVMFNTCTEWWSGSMAVTISRKWLDNLLTSDIIGKWPPGVKYVAFSASDPDVTDESLHEATGIFHEVLDRDYESLLYLEDEQIFDSWDSEFRWRYGEIHAWKIFSSPSSQMQLYYTCKEKHSMEEISILLGSTEDLVVAFEDSRVTNLSKTYGLAAEIQHISDGLPDDLK